MNNRRSTLFIDPDFQRSFLLQFLGLAIGVSVFYLGLILFFFDSLAARGAELGLSPNHAFFAFVAEQKSYLLWIFAIATVVIFAAITTYGLYVSNRIAGPIYRLRTYLRAFREGTDKAPLEFRDRDYFRELADEVRVTVTSVRDSRGA